MAQEDIIQYLRKQRGRFVDIIELIAVIPANRTNISRALRKMREHHEIKYQIIKQGCFSKFLYRL